MGYVKPKAGEINTGYHKRLPSFNGEGDDAVTIYDLLPKSPKIPDATGGQWALARAETIFTKPEGVLGGLPPANQVRICAVRLR